MIGPRSRASLLPAFLFGTVLWGQNLKQFEGKVTEFTLANGLHFILVERHESPVVSFRIRLGAGSLDDPAGSTGLAHMFERLAFKGTETIGTKDWAAEKKALDTVEESYDRLQAERNKGPRADPERMDVLDLQLRTAIDRAQIFVNANEFVAILESNGGAGLSAATTYEHTEYTCSLPSNRMELWFLMESQWFLSPVFRDFYKEREALVEDQRTRIGMNPQGLLLQEFLAAAFEAHPYHNPGLGWPSDVANLRSTAARAFFEKYYVASNMVVGIAGDVNPEEARRLAERYFGPMPARPAPPSTHTTELPQRGARRIQLELNGPPLLVMGYKRPDQKDPDDAALHILALILSSGHTGQLYRELVEDQRLAVEVQALAAYPGRDPSLFAVLAVPARDHTVEENEKAVEAVLTRLQTQKVDDEILNRARNQARGALIVQLDNNPGLAQLLTAYYGTHGDWRKLFAAIDDLSKVTADDVERVARKYLLPSQRTVAYAAPPAPGRGGRQ